MCTWYLRKPGADPNCPDSYVLYGSAPPPVLESAKFVRFALKMIVWEDR